MKLILNKFGTILNSRPAGKDAYLSAKAYLLPSDKNEKIEIDFSGVAVLTPSWADEFITPLKKEYGERVVFLQNNNPSIKATLEII